MSRLQHPDELASAFSLVVARLLAVAALAATLSAVYLFGVRPAQLHWGATKQEVERTMPEDGIVSHPAFDATRGITIHGRPQDIWPWLAQMGYQRAGFYGYDLIENLGSDTGIRSATTILPALQHPQTGDNLPLSALGGLVFGSVEPDKYLVWQGRGPNPAGVFIWELVPEDPTHTRLISRIRWRYLEDPFGFALGLFTEFGDHAAVRKILFGVRDRVEGRDPESLAAEAAEIAAWILGLFELAAGAVFVLTWHRWGRAWLLALGAGLLLQYVLYGPEPAWHRAVLPWLYLAIIAWCHHRRQPSFTPSASDTPQNAPGCG